MSNKNICAIIPIKHLSERVPGKNYRLFNKKPLFQIILETLLQSKYINHIVIDTNSEIVKNIISDKYNNNNITIYDRPENISSGDIPVNFLLENVIKELNLNYDFYFQTHTTNPLLSTETIDNSIELFIKNEQKFDSLFSVKEIRSRFYTINDNNCICALNHNIKELLPTQNLKPIYEENSCIYIFTKDVLFKNHHRIGNNPYMYLMTDLESQDIDTENDFILAEILYEKNIINKKRKVIITGVTGDIGNSIANEFKKNNYYVIGIDKINSKNKNIDLFYNKDIICKEDFDEIINNIKQKFDIIDCIVNNAAIQICKNIWEIEDFEWNDTFDCNLKTTFLFVKNLLDLLKNSDNCNIINIGSVHSICTSDKISIYSTSKAALVGLTRNLAIELSKFDIRVNSISPGAIDTKMLRDGLYRGHCGNTNALDNIKNKHLLKNIGSPMDVAELCFYITKNDFITGSNIIMDGGASIFLSTET